MEQAILQQGNKIASTTLQCIKTGYASVNSVDLGVRVIELR